LNREEAFYYEVLLTLGFSDGYNECLNHYLELEDPLSDIILELSFCSSDVNKTISVLHNYCLEQHFDEADVCDRLRLFFKDAYYSNKMSKGEVSFTMHNLTVNIDVFKEFDISIWGSMHYLDDYYLLAEDGIIPWENFDHAFFSYLDNGTPLDSNLIWSKNTNKKNSLFDRIKRILKK